MLYDIGEQKIYVLSSTVEQLRKDTIFSRGDVRRSHPRSTERRRNEDI